MDLGSVKIYDFSGYRFYYGLREGSNVLIVKTPTVMVDLISFKRYELKKFEALLRLIDPELVHIHDNLEIRLDKRIVVEFMELFPDYSVALMYELSKMSVLASNLVFSLDGLLEKLREILSDYSGTDYHRGDDERRHFIRRLIANFDRYLGLDVLALNWVNLMDCLSQYHSDKKVVAFNTWRSFLLVKNHDASGYPELYYKFTTDLYDQLEADPEVELVNLDQTNITTALDPEKKRIHDSAIFTTSPIRTL